MFRQLLLLFLFLAASEFFRLSFVPRPIIQALSLGSIIIIIVIFIINSIYDRKKGFKQNFNLEVSLFLLATVFAMFGAKWGHSQPYLLTVWAQNYMYFYFFYFFLHVLKVKPEEIERLIFIMAIIYMVLFFAQYVLYPKLLFNTRIQEARGTIRIFIPGATFAQFMFFYFLFLFFKNYKVKYGIFCLLYLMIPVMQGTRSAILIALLGALIVILISRQVKSKIIVLFLMGAGAVLLFFIFQDIFINLIEVSEKQAEQEEDDVRERCAEYFLTEFYPNKINYFLGNGHSHIASPFGIKTMYLTANYGFYQSDIGIIGVFVMYGVAIILGMIFMLRKIFIVVIDPKYNYIKYWAAILILNSIMGSLFVRPSSIVVILSAIYILDVSNYEMLQANMEKKYK